MFLFEYPGGFNRKNVLCLSLIHIYYIRGDYVGKLGVEKSYEKYLRGEKGIEILLRDAHGRIPVSYTHLDVYKRQPFNITQFMKPTLFLLAAGMGSRYGGLKQLDGLGPNGETIMDYSIYDAINAGFGKLVFVIRKDFEQDFRDKIISKYEGHIPCELVFQSIDDLPEGFTCPADRTKPWGTNHAVMMGADVIKEPFAVINCDDFYGRDSFQVMGKFLSALPENSKNVYSMVGFRVGNTLSESGTVSRGICSTDAKGLLTSVVERTKIQRLDGEVKYIGDDGEWTATPDTTPVSMNFWGFTPDYFAYSQEFFKTFLSDPKNMENLKSEFFIPLMVDKLINDGTATVEVLDTTSKWFGVTYPEDRQSVVDKIQALVDAGEYPAKLF